MCTSSQRPRVSDLRDGVVEYHEADFSRDTEEVRLCLFELRADHVVVMVMLLSDKILSAI